MQRGFDVKSLGLDIPSNWRFIMIFELFISFTILSCIFIFLGYYTKPEIKVLAVLGFATLFFLGLLLQFGGVTVRSGQPCIAVLTPDRLEKRQNGRRMKDDGEEMFTLNTQDKHGVFNGSSIRRLTPVECERLQGFPDNWTEGVSDTQRYKQMGNAVTVNVIEALARQIFKETKVVHI